MVNTTIEIYILIFKLFGVLIMKLIEKVPEGMNEYPTVENLCSELIRLVEFLRGIY